MPYIRIVKGHVLDIQRNTISDFPLQQDIVTIGRANGNDLRLIGSNKVSRFHTALIRSSHAGGPSEEYFLRDLGSLHFTRVNRDIVYSRALSDGDCIEIEGFILQYNLGAPPQPEECPIEIIESSVPLQVDNEFTEGTGTKFFSHGSESHMFEKNYAELPFLTQQALLDVINQTKLAETLKKLLNQSIEIVVQLLGANSGIMALFNTENNFSEYATYSTSTIKDRFQIDRRILDKVISGKYHHDYSTITMPLLGKTRVIGVIFLKGDFSDHTGKGKIAFYKSLAKFIGNRSEEINETAYSDRFRPLIPE